MTVDQKVEPHMHIFLHLIMDGTEYRSQQQQDKEEWDGRSGCSFGSYSKPNRGGSWCADLQNYIWDNGISCDCFVEEQRRPNGDRYLLAALIGPLKERLIAQALAEEWIKRAEAKLNARKGLE